MLNANAQRLIIKTQQGILFCCLYSQQTNTCSKSAIEILEKDAQFIQS